MIADNQTNTVYFSNLLPEEDPKRFSELETIIERAGYPVKLLAETYDYYCRDYMPVQLSENEFVQFVFRPTAYFTPDLYAEITNPVVTNLINKLPVPRFSRIIIDGGNIIRGNNRIIVTSRVIKDNLFQFNSADEIVAELERDLKSQVIVIPEYPNEATGHADGLIRFIDDHNVLLNNTREEPEKDWLQQVLQILEQHQILHHDIPCTLEIGQDTADGLYINYLHVGNLVVVPQFNQKSDKQAVTVMEKLLGQNNKIVSFDARWIAKNGGVLNCSSWTILSSSTPRA